MNEKNRLAQITKVLNEIDQLMGIYIPASPAWVLINATKNHIKLVSFLEFECDFNNDTLGVKE